MVTLIKVFAEFMKEINSEFCFLNFGGRLNKNIGKKLLEDKGIASQQDSFPGLSHEHPLNTSVSILGICHAAA
jgi:hypothetical protein